MSALRKWFFAGLLVLVPIMITLWVVNWVLSTLDQTLLILPPEYRPEFLMGFHLPGLGVVFALVVVIVIGGLASNIIGNRLLRWWDQFLNRIPVVRSIYSTVKQVSDTLFSEKGNAFREALLVQWPREGNWTIAFATGEPGGEVANYLNANDFVTVYVPTTPNPTSGYMAMVRRSDCVKLDMSVDEALTYVISMGVIVPPIKKQNV
jgi:uncharacterized membrane protein